MGFTPGVLAKALCYRRLTLREINHCTFTRVANTWNHTITTHNLIVCTCTYFSGPCRREGTHRPLPSHFRWLDPVDRSSVYRLKVPLYNIMIQGKKLTMPSNYTIVNGVESYNMYGKLYDYVVHCFVHAQGQFLHFLLC